MSFFRSLLLVSLVVMAVSFFQRDRLPEPADIRAELYREPAQTAVDMDPWAFKKGKASYIIKPLYAYEIYGLVASCHHSASFDDYYHKEWQDDLNSKDVALLYGKNLKSGVYLKYSYKSGSWTAYVEPKPGTTSKDWAAFDGACFSNNHLLALDDRVNRVMLAMRTGDQVHIKGYLVNYGTPEHPDSRHTSTIRTDQGCEVILVNEAEILKASGGPWRLLFKIFLGAALVALFGYVISWYRQFCRRIAALKKEEWK